MPYNKATVVVKTTITNKTDTAQKTVKFNGKLFYDTKYYEEDNKNLPFIKDELFEDNNVIEIEY